MAFVGCVLLEGARVFGLELGIVTDGVVVSVGSEGGGWWCGGVGGGAGGGLGRW